MDRWSAVIAIVRHDAMNAKSIRRIRFLFVFAVLLVTGPALVRAYAAGTRISFTQTITPELSARFIGDILRFIIVLLGLYGVTTVGNATTQRIALERRRNTWTLFRLAPVGNLELSVAQLTASLAPFVFVGALFIPIVTFGIQFMPHAEAMSILWTLLLVVMCCMAVGAVNGLAASIFDGQQMSRFFTGIVLAMWGFGIYSFGNAVLESAGWLAESHPHFALATWVDTFLYRISPGQQVLAAWRGKYDSTSLFFAGAGLIALSIGSTLLAAWFFGREKTEEVKAREARPVSARVSERTHLNSTVPRKPIRDGRNPFFVLEMRRSYLRHPFIAMIYCGAPLVTYLWISYTFAKHVGPESGVVIGCLILVYSVPALVGASFAAPIIARERDENTFDLVALTPNTPREILSGKVRASLLMGAPFPLIALLSYAPFWFVGGRHYEILGAFFVTSMVCLLVQQSAGVLASIVSRNAGNAASNSGSFSFFLLVGFSIVVVFVRGIVLDFGTNVNTEYRFLSFTSPLFALGYFLTVSEDPLRTKALSATLTWFAGIALLIFYGATGLLSRQMAGAGRLAHRGPSEAD